jgi:serine/threonine-protein kinase ATR
MATLQTMLSVSELASVTLQTWHKFLSTMSPSDIGPHVGPTTASIVSSWGTFSATGRQNAKRCLDYVILQAGPQLGKHLDEVADLGPISELRQTHERLAALRRDWKPGNKLQSILERSSSDNLTVALQSLGELRHFMLSEDSYIRELASGDTFDPLIGQVLVVLFSASCRDGDGTETLRLLAFECIGILGAVDPDRCEFNYKASGMIVCKNFTDEVESVQFALHLIRDVLVGAFRSTSDIKYQNHLAYAIQELLRFCKFTPALVTPGSNVPAPLKVVRNRWNSLPKHVLETVTPLLEARYTLDKRSLPALQHPIYLHQSTYREWIQLWTAHLITKASGETAQTIFEICRSAARNKDVGVAHHLLPHLVLNILISGEEQDAQDIRSELLVVLKDQVDSTSDSTVDKKLLSAQVGVCPPVEGQKAHRRFPSYRLFLSFLTI